MFCNEINTDLKLQIRPNFYMLYYFENTDLTEYKTCGHACYKTTTSRGMTLISHRKPRYFPITFRL